MVDSLFADVSEFQVGVDDSYPYRFLSFRSNDGTYRDQHFAHNLAWSKRKCEVGQLTGFLVYFVYEPNWQATIATFKTVVGTPHPRMAVMIDMESWAGKIRGSQSPMANAAREDLIAWLGAHMSPWARLRKKHRKRVIGYGNAGDLTALWPRRRDMQVVLASYGGNPAYPGKIAHQFSDRYPVPPFGNCDINSADGLSPTQLAVALGIDPDVAPAKHTTKPKPAPRPRPKPRRPGHPTLRPGAVYTVRSGDTLAQIAARFGTHWSRLQMLNHLPNPNHIYVGQHLRLI